MYRFFLLIGACLSIDGGAVGDSERVEVKSGENVTLRVQTPGNVRKAMLEKCEDRTGAPIIRYCSPEEEKRGCSVKKSDRFSIRSDTESLSVNFSDARVSDEGCYTVSYIDNFNIWKKKLFEVTVSGSLETPHKPKETPRTNSLEYLTIRLEYLNIIAVCVALLTAVMILGFIYIINHIVNRQKKNHNAADADGAEDPEIIPLSSNTAAREATGGSLEMVDETKRPVDNNNQREEERKDLNREERERVTEKTGRTRHCVDSQNNHKG